MYSISAYSTCLAILLASGSLKAQAASAGPSGAILSAYVGTGVFATPVDVTDLSTSIRVPLLGATLEFETGSRLRLGLSAGVGALPGGTAGGSTSSGTFADATALWLVTSKHAGWGVFVGPSVTYAHFGVGRAGAGGVISAGARRGIGPRFTFRAHAMSGSELAVATRLEVWLVLTR